MQFRQDGGEAPDRVVREVRIGDVALDPLNLEHAAQRAAPPDSDHVAERFVTRWLADHAPVNAFIACVQLLDDFQGTVTGTTFLIARNQESDTSLVIRMGCHETLRGDDHCGKTAFHVGAAAAVNSPVADIGLEGVGLPVVQVPCGHDVGMPGKTEHR